MRITRLVAMSTENREPTDRQREILRLIRALTASRGFPPTLHEVSAGLGMKAKGGAASGIRALVTKGLLTVLPRVARSMTLTQAGQRAADSVAEAGAAPGL